MGKILANLGMRLAAAPEMEIMKPKKPSAAPASARSIAWAILNQVEQKSAWAEELLPGQVAAASLSDLDRRLARELVFGAIKSRAYLDYALKPLFRTKAAPSEPLLNLLRLGAYQLLLLERIPAHAAVHESVELAKQKLPESQVKFVNAILREISRRGKPALPDPVQSRVKHDAVAFSFPEFLVQRWVDRFGPEAAEAMMAAANEAPPVVARVNLARSTREAVLKEIQEQGGQAEIGLVPSALCFPPHSGDPARLPGFAQGMLYFQDQASQMIGYLVDSGLRHICLDYCSAPGGKATHLAELGDGRNTVYAFDNHSGKLKTVEENAKRLGLENVRVVAKVPEDLKADRVLVDAPCSGLGTLRRHAEIRWRVQEADFKALAKNQGHILSQAAPFVKVGGHLIYSTCTTEPEENEDVIRDFIRHHSDFELVSGPGKSGFPKAEFWGPDGFFRTYPGHPELDSMFAARLIRKEQLSFRF
jgi:16S rRNA (cytosine967-C5)-methyltransferase